MKSINRNFLITSLMVLILFAFAYIASGQIIFNADSTLPFTSLQAIFVGGIILSLFSLYVACVCNKKKPLKSYEIILIFASIALFLVTTINICSYPENTDLIVQSAEGIYFFGNLNINCGH